jgi:Ras-related protein Rab-13
LGCKCDLEAERKIKKEAGSKMAAKYNIKFFEVSAKVNKGIEDAFAELTNEVFRERQ